MSGGFVTVTVSPSLASELACQRDGPGAGAGASTGTASRAGSEERREASKERARLDDQPDGDDEPDSARRGLTAKDHKSPHKRRRVVVVLDEYGCADDFIDSQHRRFIKLVGEWVDCARKIGDYRYAAFLADFYNSMKYAMPIIGHQELPGMATVLLEVVPLFFLLLCLALYV